MRTCPNCGNHRVENYCPECGQRSGQHLGFGEFLRDVADDQLSLDAKVPRTLRALFFRPGLLTAEYRDGRVARYIPPFRLYILASVLFFVLLSFFSRRSDWAERAEQEFQREMAGDTSARAVNSDTTRGLEIGVSNGGRDWMDSVRVNVPWPWLDQRIEANLKALGELSPSAALRRVTAATIEEIPKVMFVLLPVFALLLKLLYIRRVRYYIEHFVFALHFHAFAYVLFAIALIIGSSWTFLIPAIVLPVYMLLAMKRAYGQGWVLTTIKWTVLGFSYFFLLTFGLVFALIWALAAA